jgi:tRNA A-37 threonylcarbamoyl transferase component Bud32
MIKRKPYHKPRIVSSETQPVGRRAAVAAGTRKGIPWDAQHVTRTTYMTVGGKRKRVFVRNSISQRKLDIVHHLEKNGVNVEMPLANKVAKGTEKPITIFLEHGTPVSQCIPKKSIRRRVFIQRTLQSLAEQIGKMHAAEVRHDDLHANNLTITDKRNYTVGIVDFKTATRVRKVDWTNPDVVFGSFTRDYHGLDQMMGPSGTLPRTREKRTAFFEAVLQHYPIEENVRTHVLERIKRKYNLP